MKRIIFLLTLVCIALFPIAAQEPAATQVDESRAAADTVGKAKARTVFFIPILSYGVVGLDDQIIHSPGGGLVIQGKNFFIAGLYGWSRLINPPLADFPTDFHSVQALLEGRAGRHHYRAFFQSKSDLPVAGGLNTFSAGAGYGYYILDSERWTLLLGLGLIASDFGLELPNGDPWPVMPIPIVRFGFRSKYFESEFNFFGMPKLNIVVGPQSKYRFKLDVWTDRIKSFEDILFDASFNYRFFGKDEHKLGDFMGIALGLRSDDFGMDLAGKKGVFDFQYYGVYASFDATLIKVTGGYAFASRQDYGDYGLFKRGDGFFASIQAMYRF